MSYPALMITLTDGRRLKITYSSAPNGSLLLEDLANNNLLQPQIRQLLLLRPGKLPRDITEELCQHLNALPADPS